MGSVRNVSPVIHPFMCNTIELPEVPKTHKYRGGCESSSAAVGHNGLTDGDNLMRFKLP